MSTSDLRSRWAANRPPKPEPMMTTRGRPVCDGLAGVRAGEVVMMIDPSTSAPGGPEDPGAIEVTLCPVRRRRAARAGHRRTPPCRLFAVGAAADLGVPLPQPRRRRRLELLEPRLCPLRRRVGARQCPRRLPGGAVGDVLAGRGDQDGVAEDAGRE